jgi:DNA-directed RNA polymerase specialized sigma24 family protein
MNRKTRRVQRMEVLLDPAIFERMPESRSAWYESREEVARALEEAAIWEPEKRRLMRWVCKQMRRRLTTRQQRYIELHYLEELTFEQIGRRVKRSSSGVARTVRLGRQRLIEALREDPPTLSTPRRTARGSR